MRESVKARWVEALRSGDYTQTEGQLRDDKGYCCLGVLCDVYKKTRKKKGKWECAKKENPIYMFLGESALLPKEVVDWAGLEGRDPDIGEEVASYWNDSYNKTFKQIAKLIEKHL